MSVIILYIHLSVVFLSSIEAEVSGPHGLDKVPTIILKTSHIVVYSIIM